MTCRRRAGRSPAHDLIGLATGIVALGLMFLIARTISRPLAAGVRFARTLAEGDFTTFIDTGAERTKSASLRTP